MFGFGPEAIAVAALAALAAGFVRGLAGFGLSAVLVGLVSLFLIGLTDWRRIRSDADASAIPIIALALAATPLGLWALVLLSADVARLLIALVSLGAFVLVVVPLGKDALARRPAMWLSGFFIGFFGGFAGMPGPGMAPFYLRGKLEPITALASMMAIFLILTPIGAMLFVVPGVGGWREVAFAALLFPAVLAGDWLGHAAFGRVTTRHWQVSVAVMLAIAAAGAVWKLLQG